MIIQYRRFASFLIMCAVFLLIALSAFAVQLVSASTAVDGHWTGTTSLSYPMSFDVSSGGTSLTNFTIQTQITAQYCSWTETKTITNPAISIVNDQFSFDTGTFSLSGEFNSTTTASGTYTYPYQYDSTCGYFSQNGTWTASIPLPPPDAFSKSDPANGATGQSTSVSLSWSTSSGATSYEYCYDTTNDNTCSTWFSNGSTTIAALSGLTQGTTYYWQARAINAGGTTYADGDSTAYWSFTTVGYTISGNAGVAGATLSYMDGTAKTTTANGSGDYSLTVPYNWTGTITPTEAGYTFTPSNRSYNNVSADQSAQNYTATLTVLVPAQSISSGYDYTCKIKSDSTVDCWGNSDYGSPPGDTFVQVSAGGGGDGSHACALRADGTVACWGSNYEGQATPPGGTFTWVSAGGDVSCGIKSDATLACWGGGVENWGMIPPPSGNFTRVALGRTFACGIQTDGTLTCWGADFAGQLSPPSGVFIEVTAGETHACGLRDDSMVVCWGGNDHGQANPLTGAFTRVSAGLLHTCGLRTDGTLGCWGGVNPQAPSGTFTELSAGRGHTCALRTDGKIACWWVNGIRTITINPTSLPAGSVGSAYSQALSAAGGTEPYHFSVIAGALPPGLALSADGILSGMPITYGTYDFTVKAVDTHDVVSGPQTYTLTYTVPLPGDFTKSGPTNGAAEQPLGLDLNWNASSGATSYEYCYDTSNDDACSAWTSSGNATSAVLSGLMRGTTYYWQVRAANTGGITYADGSPTAYWSFTTLVTPPGDFTKSGPTNGATEQPTNLSLSWSASSGATFYEYCYDMTNDNACSAWTSSGNATSTVLSDLMQGTTYYWQVRAANTGGFTYADSSPTAYWSFTTAGSIFDAVIHTTNDDGVGSLRYAINNAPENTTLTFDTEVFNTPQIITLTSGTLTIERNLTIQGPGANLLAIDGNLLAPVFAINDGTVFISNLTIQRGNYHPGIDECGGGIMKHAGTLTVSDSTFLNNIAWSGAGICNEQGTLTVNNSIFSGNGASSGGGGGITNGNWSQSPAMLTVTNSTFLNNGSGVGGGGIFNIFSTATVIGSTFSDNSVSGTGAGINNVGGTLTISNSTFANNLAYLGAAIYTDHLATISNCTFSGNSTGSDGYGGGIFNNAGTLNVGSSIVANNTRGSVPDDLRGSFVSLGHNLIGSATDTGAFLNTDQQNIDPLLNALGDNGGSTQTMSLQAGSPAIGAGNCNLVSPGVSVTTDQRGVTRRTPCDAGAYESSYTPAPTIISFTPSSGLVGMSVSISGTNFIGATAVQFNGISASSFTVVSTTSITVTVPVGATSGAISVTTPGGTATSSTDFTVTTGDNPPGAFTKSGPINGATEQPTNLSLSWNASSEAVSYEYCYDTSNDNACSAWTSSGSATSADVTGLALGAVYYWQVRAVNSVGTTYSDGSSTAYWSFTTVSSVYDPVVHNTNDDGAGSLRYAINNAPDNTTLTFDPLVFNTPQTIALTSGSLTISRNITINGTGATLVTVSGAGSYRPIHVANGAHVILSDMTIANGVGGSVGGGIYLEIGAQLTLSRMTVKDNSGPAGGGGIYNQGGSLTIDDSLIADNHATYGSGLSNNGNGIMAITRSTLSGNTADGNTNGEGGALFTNSGMVTITESTLSGNSSAIGAGLMAHTNARVDVVRTTFTNNTATNAGGAILNRNIVNVIDSTLTNNSAGTSGGAIFNYYDPAAMTTIVNSTLFANSASTSGGNLFQGDGIITVRNSIVAGALISVNCSGTITDGGHNLSDDATCGFGSTSLSTTNPLLDLAGLQDNGGPTQTIALQTGSPAINAGDNSLATDANGDPITTDQRGAGFPRIIDNTVDIGAFESSVTPSTFCDGVSEIPATECDALASLYSSTSGQNWTNHTGWLDTSTPCSWYGVSCSSGHVIQLNLSANSLGGTIPPEIGSLTNMQRLYLDTNNLTGSIPPELGNLTSLVILELSDNPLGGSIPPEMGSLTNLVRLGLHTDQLTGNIPPELGNLANLRELYLLQNTLGGSIPPELGSLSNLITLYADNNSLTGSIPPELGNLVNLQVLLLQDNHLTGSIPAELGNMTSLANLSLWSNNLSGSIPSQLSNLTHLQYLGLSFNSLSGDIPSELSTLTSLEIVYLDYNMLTATDPDVISWLAARAPDWASTQSVPPSNVQAVALSSNSVQVSWTPIAYTEDGGFYEVGYASTAGGPYISGCITADKTVPSCDVENLTPNTSYYFAVRTFTPAHGLQLNDLLSDYGQEVPGVTNTPPTAVINAPVAGDITSDTHGLVTVVLNASGSTDPEDAIDQLSFAWSWLENGAPVTADGAIIAHSFPLGSYNISLTVTDTGGLSDSASVTINVVLPPNQTPTVDAGLDATITLPTNTVALNGSATDDGLPLGSALTTTWSGPVGVAFADANALSTTATFPSAGSYTLSLTAFDSEQSATDDVIITVNPAPNQPPIANAGDDQTVTDSDHNGSELVTLDGSLSNDPDGTIASYSWTENGTEIATGVSAQASLTVGTHTITLIVTDNDGVTASDSLIITILPYTDTVPPVITMLGDNPLELTVGTAYVEPGYTATDDVDGDITANVVVTGSVDTNAVGSYTLTYNVSDAAGNAATPVARTVNVVSATASVDVTFTIAGGHATHALPLEVTLVDPATSAIVLQQSLTSTGDASSGHFSLSGITPGTYDLYVKGSNTLRSMQSVTIVAGSNAVTFTALRSGDANGDNVVSLADFSILALSFNKTPGTPGYDGRADFNGDTVVSLADFSKLALNFNTVGVTLPTP